MLDSWSIPVKGSNQVVEQNISGGRSALHVLRLPLVKRPRLTFHHQSGGSGALGHVEDGLREAAAREYASKRPRQGEECCAKEGCMMAGRRGGRDECGEF
ncbi:unnamed protein product [Ectocarpus sp. 12 AP-2014]